MKIAAIALTLVAGLATVASAQAEDRSPSRLRHVEGDAVLQRASDAGSEEARPNIPFLPGDRLWTQGSGRVELQFGDGSFVHLDSRSKLDYDTSERDRAVLKLWSGAIILRRYADRNGLDFTFATPDGAVDIDRAGRYRIDVDSAETRVDVLEGEATFEAAGRRVELRSGERAVARDGQLGSIEVASADDEFDFWSEDRDRAVARNGRSREYLPEEVLPYENDFDTYGSWDYADANLGHVWRPRVASYWTPYNDGHWLWTHYGWTWVPDEPWGWAAFHYGRWGYSIGLGWYWIPGRHWSPAWVSWAVSDRYVGWCPLGYRDRPVYLNVNVFNVGGHRRGKGHATPRSAWTYALRTDLERRAGGRARWTRPDSTADLKVFESPNVRLTRSLEPTQVADRAVPRIKRGPGDVVPELRDNPKYLPFPPRARPRDGEVRRDTRRTEREAAAPSAKRQPDRTTDGRVWRTRPVDPEATERRALRPDAGGDQATAPPRIRRARPTGERPRVQRTPEDTEPSWQQAPSSPRARPERVERLKKEHAEPPSDRSREVLRRFFRPAEEGQGRPGGHGEGARRRGGDGAPEARRAAPPPPPPVAEQPQHQPEKRAVPRRERPPRDRDN